jgi:hypothetical protein
MIQTMQSVWWDPHVQEVPMPAWPPPPPPPRPLPWGEFGVALLLALAGALSWRVATFLCYAGRKE